MSLKIFIENLFNYLELQNIEFAVLRGYENLPEKINGNDLDIVLHKKNIKKCLDYIFNLEQVRVTSFAKRLGTLNLFLCIDEKIYVQIDLISSLNYNGLDYINLNDILAKKQKFKSFYVPAKEHQFVLMLLPYYFYKKRINPKYINELKTIVCNNRLQITDFLTKKFSSKIAINLADIKDNISIKNTFYKKNVFQSLYKIPAYYLHELRSLLIKPYHKRIAFLGVDGAGKSTLIGEFMKHAEGMSKKLVQRHLKPVIFLKKRSVKRGVVTDPHGQKKRSWFSSNLKLPMFFIEYWIDFYQNIGRGSELHIYDRYFDDILVDNKRYRFDGSKFIAKAFTKIVPRPIIFIHVFCDPKTIIARKAELPLETLVTLTDAYKAFLNNKQSITVATNISKKEALNSLVEQLNTELHLHNKKRLL